MPGIHRRKEKQKEKNTLTITGFSWKELQTGAQPLDTPFWVFFDRRDLPLCGPPDRTSAGLTLRT